MDDLVGVVLAAGRGTRLRPLTRLRPKALCPVGNVPLVDLALERVRPAVGEVAVNLHHGRRTLDAHLADDVHRSVEADQPLGTAGALGLLRSWIDGRGVLVVNARCVVPGFAGAVRRRVGRRAHPPPARGRRRAAPHQSHGRRPHALGRRRRARARAVGPLRGLVARRRRRPGGSRWCATTATSSTAAPPSSTWRRTSLASGGASVVEAGARVEGVVGSVRGLVRRRGARPRVAAPRDPDPRAHHGAGPLTAVSAGAVGRRAARRRGSPAAGRRPRRSRCRGCGGPSR